MDVAYCLSIHPSLTAYASEIDYVWDFLERIYGLRREASGTEAPLLHYGPDAPPGAAVVPACFFREGTRLDRYGIHLERDRLTALETQRHGARLVPDRFGRGERVLHYDAIGLIFLLLSRLEERGAQHRDRYGRFPAAESILARQWSIGSPAADLAAGDIVYALFGRPLKPRKAYTVWFTHDVDRLKGYHAPLRPLRTAVACAVHRGWREGWSELQQAYFSAEPWTSFTRLMTMAESANLQSRFFFMGPSSSELDSTYAVRWPRLLRRMADLVRRRGHVLGFHPGRATYDDAECWRREREELESILGVRATIGRQHQLRFDVEKTWEIWDAQGMEVDSTLSYPDISGFRSGTCHSHRAYSVTRRRSLRLLERPTQVADHRFFHERYGAISESAGFAECEAVIQTVKSHCGDLTILFHTGYRTPAQWAFLKSVLALV